MSCSCKRDPYLAQKKLKIPLPPSPSLDILVTCLTTPLLGYLGSKITRTYVIKFALVLNLQTFCSIQNYEVLDLLGRGGFACVYRARCLSASHGEVAIKMVKYRLLLINVIKETKMAVIFSRHNVKTRISTTGQKMRNCVYTGCPPIATILLL